MKDAEIKSLLDVADKPLEKIWDKREGLDGYIRDRVTDARILIHESLRHLLKEE